VLLRPHSDGIVVLPIPFEGLLRAEHLLKFGNSVRFLHRYKFIIPQTIKLALKHSFQSPFSEK